MRHRDLHFLESSGNAVADTFPERMPDGRAYGSGTAFEVLSALRARKENRTRPDVYVFRKNAIPTVPINDLAARAEADSQWTRLEDFFAEHFESADKRILRVVERFRETGSSRRKSRERSATGCGPTSRAARFGRWT